MTYLLDTHTLIWAIEFPKQLTEAARAVIANTENKLLISTISAFEIATKVRLGKLPVGEKLHAQFAELLVGAGIGTVEVSVPIALRAGRLAGEHRDPFDRLLAATCIELDLPILSADAVLDGFGVRRVW